MNAIDALVEIFTWVGFGLGALVFGVALIVYLADGTWVPARGVVEDLGEHRVVRWFDADGGVNEASLTEAESREIGARDMADIWIRQGRGGRMRLHPRSPGVRALVLLASGLVGVGVVCLVASLVMLFTRG